MKIVIWKSPKFLSGLFKLVFHLRCTQVTYSGQPSHIFLLKNVLSEHRREIVLVDLF